MANYEFDKITYENDYYYPRDTRCFLVRGTQNGVTNNWTGKLPDGMFDYPTSIDETFSIDFYLPYNSNNKGVTLNLSNKGAKKVYLCNSNTQVTNEFIAGSVVRMTYIPTLDNRAGAWKLSTTYSEPAKIYDAGTALTLNGNTFNHNDYMSDEGTIGRTQNTSGAIVEIPYLNYNKQGHITGKGVRTHTVTYPSITVKQDGLEGFIATHFAICSTQSNIAEKSATLFTGTPSLEEGLRVTVKFTNTNTANNPSFNLNGLGAKPIYLNGERITSSPGNSILSGTVELVYDGTQWQLVGNNTLNYGVVLVSKSNISSLPVTIADSHLTTRHLVVKSQLSNPSAQKDDWTISTSNGSLEILGTIEGVTDIILYLALGAEQYP